MVDSRNAPPSGGPAGPSLPPLTRERVGCYTGLYEAYAFVAKPRDVGELREWFRYARD
jgi:hypothetical protein